jgi:trimethylamine--corrinoid protein Co-methyltransferase|tara:strand:- start:10778 stop:12298 length:1521 start_codon:yes stop_codon:yes gene_type:complete
VARAGHRKKRNPATVHQLPFQTVENPYTPVEVLDEEQVEKIVDGALKILSEQGMRFMQAESRKILASAGARVDETEQMVLFDRDMVLEKVALAPSSFGLRARNPAHDLIVGTNKTIFSSVGGPAFCSDLENGRRAGTYDELCDYLKLVQCLNIIHQEGGGAFEAMDLPAESRHLDLYLAQLTLLDKNSQAYALGRERTIDCIEMTAIALGCDRTELRKNPAIMAVINTNSPRQLDIPMSEAVLELARSGQVSCITPFTLAGSMSPVTLAGTLAQQTAEIMAVTALAETAAPGAAVVYGSFSSNVDMQSGEPALGTPEFTKMALASCQIARRLGLPSRTSNTTTSNCVDAQSAYESEMSLWGSLMGHANLINHAAGWLEGGLTASFEKLILDAEMLQMMVKTLEPIKVNDDEIALDAIATVEPGGHHFLTEHTLARYETAFYPTMLSDRKNFEDWREKGSQDTAVRANAIWKKLLLEYEKPAIDVATEEALQQYVAKRKLEIAAQTK